jgi:hypothetical protein
MTEGHVPEITIDLPKETSYFGGGPSLATTMQKVNFVLQ